MHLGTLQVLSEEGKTKYAGIKYEYPLNHIYKFYLSVIGDVFPALAREEIAKTAIENDMDYIFMIDDDMLSEVDLFEKLVMHNVDIVAPLAFTRFAPHKPVIYNLEDGYDKVTNLNYYINRPILTYPKNSLIECDAVGFGAVLIKTKVLRGMDKPWFMSTSGAGEDIQFCFNAKKAGYKVFMDTATKLGHLGAPKVVTEEVYEKEENIKELRKIYGDFKKR